MICRRPVTAGSENLPSRPLMVCTGRSRPAVILASASGRPVTVSTTRPCSDRELRGMMRRRSPGTENNSSSPISPRLAVDRSRASASTVAVPTGEAATTWRACRSASR